MTPPAVSDPACTKMEPLPVSQLTNYDYSQWNDCIVWQIDISSLNCTLTPLGVYSLYVSTLDDINNGNQCGSTSWLVGQSVAVSWYIQMSFSLHYTIAMVCNNYWWECCFTFYSITPLILANLLQYKQVYWCNLLALVTILVYMCLHTLCVLILNSAFQPAHFSHIQ